jgi:hypothetical protein
MSTQVKLLDPILRTRKWRDMRWGAAWKWILTALAVLFVARTYFAQELITLFLFFSVVYALLLLAAVFSLVSMNLIERGIDFLESRLRLLAARTRQQAAMATARTWQAESRVRGHSK